MAAQGKTRQAKAAISRTLPKEVLLDRVASGSTLQQIADEVESLTGQKYSKYYICKTLQQWPEYQDAKKAQAQLHAERIASIADEVESGKLDPASARVSSDNRKWVAARLDPATYGDKVQADINLTDVTQLHLASLRDRMKTVSTQ